MSVGRSFVPEIVSADLGEAAGALKVSCLYFERTAFQHRALLARPIVGAQIRSGGSPIRFPRYHTDTDVARFLERLEVLVKAGVLLPTPSPPEELMKRALRPWEEAIERVEQSLMASLKDLEDPDQALSFARAEMTTVASLMWLAGGVPAATSPAIHGWFMGGFRRQLREGWESLPPSQRSRVHRDSLATKVLTRRLPSVRTRSFEQVLELRETMRDNLLRFRAEMGALSSETAEGPTTPEFHAHLERVLEERVDPAILELRAQMHDLGARTHTDVLRAAATTGGAVLGLSFISGLPAAAQLATATVGAGVAGAVSWAERRRARREVGRHPLALLVVSEGGL